MASGDVTIPTEELRALERSGRWEAAFAEHARVLCEALRNRDPVALAASLYGQARVLYGWERHLEAEEVAELCREVAQRTCQAGVAAQALNLLAALRFMAGDHAVAEALYLKALDEARDLGDDRLVGFASQNLGVIADARGDLEEARRCYLESMGACGRSGDKVSSVMVYNNLGITCGKLGEYLQAERYFEHGIELAEQIPHLPMLAVLHTSWAATMVRAGDPGAARATLDCAESLARSIEAVVTLAEIARLRGVLALEARQWREAEKRFAEALRLSESARQPLTRAETLEGLAELRWRTGRRQEARAVLTRALRDYWEFRAEPRAVLAAQRLAQWEREERTDAAPELQPRPV